MDGMGWDLGRAQKDLMRKCGTVLRADVALSPTDGCVELFFSFRSLGDRHSSGAKRRNLRVRGRAKGKGDQARDIGFARGARLSACGVALVSLTCGTGGRAINGWAIPRRTNLQPQLASTDGKRSPNWREQSGTPFCADAPTGLGMERSSFWLRKEPRKGHGGKEDSYARSMLSAETGQRRGFSRPYRLCISVREVESRI